MSDDDGHRSDPEGVIHVAAGDAAGGANAIWHRPLMHVIAGALSASTAQTHGMTRLEAISGKTVGSENLWMGETHVAPETSSGDHHHGHAETAIYVVSGNPRFVFLVEGQETVVETGPGDYIFVPPFTPHREENPSIDIPAVVVIARTTQEGIVVNLPSLWPTDSG
ncbi:MAG: Cupin 2 conserved barrel domain protein [Ilumatobacteraceae bacterium]|nr:Cupin 2 conserved barrel domain protein [Ilumatobacteraceae bacterium]